MSTTSRPTTPPNLILVCSDQHRAAAAGCYGNPVCRTPTIDRLAAQGMCFERCLVQNPVCMPQRASILTGCLSHTTRVLANGAPLRRDLPTAADLLAARGYRTAAVGKLHLTPQSEGVPEAPFYGFEHLDSVEDNKIGPYLDWALEHFPQFEGYLVGTLFNLPTNDAWWRGRRDFRTEYLQAREKFVKPFEISATCNWGFGHYSPLPEEAHHNRWIADHAIARLSAHDRRAPLFLWVGFQHPHNPFDPPERFRRMYPPESVDPRLHRDGEEALWPPHIRAFRRYYSVFTERDWQVLRGLYYGNITFMDEEIGRIVRAAEQTLDMSNTIVIYTSDHGEILGDHGICGKTAYHYDSCLRVPLVARWDGHWAPGARPRDIVESTDLLPTLLDAMGLDVESPMDGRSFAPLLRGEPFPHPRGHAFAESYSGGPEDPTPAPHTWARTIRTDRWRATFYPNADHGELFDLEHDPGELWNLWFQPEHRDVIEAHRRLLLDRLILADYPVRGRRAAV